MTDFILKVSVAQFEFGIQLLFLSQLQEESCIVQSIFYPLMGNELFFL